MSERQGGHGGIDGETWRGSRAITLSGVGRWRDARAAHTAVNELLGLDPSPGTLTVTDELGAMSATVRISASPAVQWITGEMASWDLGLVAPDHRRYGPLVEHVTALPLDGPEGLTFPASLAPADFGEPGSLGMVEVTNHGTAPTEPLIVLDAGGTGLTGPIEVYAWGPAASLRYDGDLAPGQRVVLDGTARTVMLNGRTNRRELLARAQWWSLASGATSVVSWSHRGGQSPDARMTVGIRSAYL